MVGDFFRDNIMFDQQSTKYEKPFKDFSVFYENMTENFYRSKNDPYIFPIKMTDDVMKLLPPTAVFTGEFDFFRRDACAFAERLQKNKRLYAFFIESGLNHASPFTSPCESQY